MTGAARQWRWSRLSGAATLPDKALHRAAPAKAPPPRGQALFKAASVAILTVQAAAAFLPTGDHGEGFP